MSRTDVHRPAWVQHRDPWMRRELAPSHRHVKFEEWDQESRRWLVRRHLPCDLDEYLGAAGWVQTRCMMEVISGRNIYRRCGCNPSGWQRKERRQERVRWRATARHILALVDRSDVDVVSPRRRSLR